MKRLILILCLALSLIPAGLVMATADVSNAIYRAPITLLNTGAAATAVSCNVSISTPSLISGGFANSAVSNVAILTSGGADAPFMPGYTTNPWMVFTPSMDATSSQSMTLYTDNSSAGKIRYFPGTAGMTRADNALIEVGDNYTSIISGYFPAATSGGTVRAAYKQSTLTTWLSAPLTVSTIVYGTALGGSESLRPDADSLTGIPITTGANHYGQVDEVVANDADYVATNLEAGTTDVYTLSDPAALPVGATIDSIDINFRMKVTNGAVPGHINPGIISGAKSKYNGDYAWSNAGAFATYAFNVTQWSDATPFLESQLAALTVSLSNITTDTAPNESQVSQVFITVNWSVAAPTRQVDSAFTAGEHTYTVTWDGTDLKAYIDSVLTDTATGAYFTANDNANAWYWGENNVMPYIEYVKNYKAGVLKQHIIWQYAATFTDQSGNAMDVTPSFRTTSSDADVSATLGAFSIISPAAAGASTVPISTDNWTSTDNGTSSFSTTVTPTMPGATIISAISTASGIPSQLPFTWISGLIILIISLALSYFLRANNTMSLTTKMGLIFLCMLVMVVTSIYDAWMIIMWAPIAIALAMGSKQYGW